MKKIGCCVGIPRSASKTLYENLDYGYALKFEIEEHPIIFENHQILRLTEKIFDLSDVFVFTVVRHPYDRVMSWYFFHKQWKVEPYNSLSFDEWIKEGCPHHWTMQSGFDWKEENKSPLLQYNFIEGSERGVDFIGKVENLKDDLPYIVNRLNKIFENNNLSHRFKYLDHVFNYSARPKDQNLTQEQKDLVYQLFKKDFDYFGYLP
jgi:hypothetical protein